MVQRFDAIQSGGAVFWDGRSSGGESVAPGIYFARWRSGDSAASTKLIVVK
jgi:hypothetical protein